MSLFDSVIFKCPNCGADIEAQSKAGYCRLDRFVPREVPLVVALSIEGETVSCEGGWSFDERYEGCGMSWVVQPDIHVPETVAMKLERPE
jgi:hypothetical protein